MEEEQRNVAEIPDVTRTIEEIRLAISAELTKCSEGIRLKVWRVEKQSGLLTIVIDDNSKQLDQSMEDGTLGWSWPERGQAEIVSIVPESWTIHAILKSGPVPRPQQTIYLNPPRFLEPLLELWKDDNLARRAANLRNRLRAPNFDGTAAPGHQMFKTLRTAQQSAFRLLGYSSGFLWGPPGTGKTFTLGCMLGSYLLHRPNDRVLLLSSTNVAVDQAMDRIDAALLAAGAEDIRKRCFRFGARFDPKAYENREHMIPVKDQTLVQKYRDLLKTAPDPEHAAAYAAWRERLEDVRRAIQSQNREFLEKSRVAAMTATLGTFQYTDLQLFAPYDLVVFDEASQAGIAHAAMLSVLGKRALFAGDHKQLSPIVQSNDKHADQWMRRSAFHYLDESGTQKVILDEQERMAPQICEAVKKLFYPNELRVAKEKLADQNWHAARRVKCPAPLGENAVTLLRVASKGVPRPGTLSFSCEESAMLATRIAASVIRQVGVDNISILTPYRAQRHVIARELESAGLPRALVSTVHRAQGSERLVVIFDPAAAGEKFVQGEEGKRLLNVAFSRAKGRLFVLLQPDYVYNKVLDQLGRMFPPKRVNLQEIWPDSQLPFPKGEFALERPLPSHQSVSEDSGAEGAKPRVTRLNWIQHDPELEMDLRQTLTVELFQEVDPSTYKSRKIDIVKRYKYTHMDGPTRDRIIAEVDQTITKLRDRQNFSKSVGSPTESGGPSTPHRKNKNKNRKKKQRMPHARV